MDEPWYREFDAEPMPRSFLARPTVEVAAALIGCFLLVRDPRGELVGRIVEAEAYTGVDDAASHAAKRRSGLVSAMWGEPGRAYVYTSYGLHDMLNIVAKPPDQTGAVLIRALDVVAGQEVVRVRRPLIPDHRLAAGPGLTCRAYGISASDHGADMIDGPRFSLAVGSPPARIHVSGRIGIRQAAERPWRFFDADSRSISAHRRGVPVGAMEAI